MEHSEVIQLGGNYYTEHKPASVPLFESVPILHKYTFTEEDNYLIKEGEHHTIYTCSMEHYQYIRPKLTDIFSQFVTLTNWGNFRLNDILFNEDNQNFKAIIESHNPEHQLFIVPTYQSTKREFEPLGGIRFVTNNFLRYNGTRDGRLIITLGDNRLNIWERLVDQYMQFSNSNNTALPSIEKVDDALMANFSLL